MDILLTFRIFTPMQKEVQNLSQSQLISLALELKGEAKYLQQQNNHLFKNHEKIESKSQNLETEILRLETKVQQLTRLLYGQKRERFENPAQPKLPFTEEPEKAEVRQEETVKKITYERRKPVKQHPERPCQIIIRYVRPKYAKKDKEGVVIAKLPGRTFDKCMEGNGLLTSIIVDKFVGHLPLYRQLQRFKREKIPISPSTVDGWVKQVGGLLEILYDHILNETRYKGYLQADKKPIKMLDRDKKGSCHLGYFWVYRSPIDKTVLFHYQTGRSGRAGREILDGFKGYLQTDGYQVYDSIAESKEIIHLNCWAHALREFYQALPNDQTRASIALSFI